MSALLVEVMACLDADSGGILGWDPRVGELRLLREVKIGTTSYSSFAKLISAELLKKSPQDYFHRQVSFDPNVSEASLYLRRIWPIRLWEESNRWTHWLYLAKPRRLESASGSEFYLKVDLGHHLDRITDAWFAWKQKQIEGRTTSLLPKPDDASEKSSLLARITAAFERPIVRPVAPRHLVEVLDGFLSGFAPVWSEESGSSASSQVLECKEWLDRVEAIILKRMVTEACDECTHSRTTGVCPQTPRLNESLRAVGNLFVWRTTFWRIPRPTDAIAKESFDYLRDRGLKALHQVIPLLDKTVIETFSTDDRRLDLKRGREAVLLRFFLGRAIQESLSRLGGEWSSEFARPDNLKYPAKLAELAIVLLSGNKWTDEAIETLLYVMAEYGHRILGVPKKIELVNQLRQTLRGESALYTLKQRYRDHFFHTIEVCLIGYVLLTSYTDKSCAQTVGDWIVEKCKTRLPSSGGTPTPPAYAPFDCADFMAQWWMAALIHDTAYGIDILGGTRTLLSFFKNNNDVSAFDNAIGKATDDMGKEMAKLAPEELTGAFELKRGDHGVIAASALAAFLQRVDKSEYQRFMPAVRAIAFHNSKHPRVDAARDPVAALLILCDTIQDWGRTQLGFHRSPTMILSRLIAASKTPTEDLFGPAKRFAISLDSNGNSPLSQHFLVEPRNLTVDIWYGKNILKNCGVFYQWADVTHNLQRVNFEPWGLNLELNYHVPESECQDKYGSHLAQFEEMITDREAAFLKPWSDAAYEANALGTGKRNDNWSVQHQLREEQDQDGIVRKYEVLSYNLCVIGKRFASGMPLMGGSLSDFDTVLRNWSGYRRTLERQEPDPRPPI